MSNNIIPTLKYADASTAVTWLCEAFGFSQHLVVAGETGQIDHAQLVLNGGMIMLSSVRDSEFESLQQPPSATGGVVTQSPYIVIEDVDGHCSQAIAAGAEIVMAPADQDYGGRLYSARDPEGYLWNFGSYDPWA